MDGDQIVSKWPYLYASPKKDGGNESSQRNNHVNDSSVINVDDATLMCFDKEEGPIPNKMQSMSFDIRIARDIEWVAIRQGGVMWEERI